ncbi:2,3-bisphosphoglycerate-dependent phosphoglycerate mutase [uncultured archaeon]|nr:2,3-bisphosphoglycerate-dependent phosphoglycerate mutase [uncultured archaeon]
MSYLALVRHGQSVWNLQNRFTGWIDVPLSPHGEEEAHAGAQALLEEGLIFQQAYTSSLLRAQQTLDILLCDLEQASVPVLKDAALNERHYGALQGMNKDEMRQKYGPEQVHIWRRSYDVRPPKGECLADTAARAWPFYQQTIVPKLGAGQNVLVAAHGNSLRAIVMHLDQLSKEDVLKLEIPTGVPHVYEFDKGMKILAKEILD